MTRRGFTLVELLVTLAVMGILGTALARITINQSRYVGEQEALMEARQTARQAMTLLATEMRRVSDRGVIQATADTVHLRVPYAFGMLCEVSGGARLASLLPYDSASWANAGQSLLTWRSGGGYGPGQGVTVTTATDPAPCDTDSIRVIPGGRLVNLSPPSASSGANAGDIMYIYERVKYFFGASTSMPGRRALFRQAGGSTEELLFPFASTARFAFLTGSRLTLSTTPPADIDDLRGLELRLIAESSTTPSGRTAPMTYDLRPRVRFGNLALE